jgi:hypothetical protein
MIKPFVVHVELTASTFFTPNCTSSDEMDDRSSYSPVVAGAFSPSRGSDLSCVAEG